MRRLFFALMLVSSAFSVGCGAPEEADMSHLEEESPEAEAAREEARARYQQGQHGAQPGN